MALFKTRGAEIRGIVSVVPANSEDNSELSIIPEQEREILVKHTGIRFRRIVKDKSIDVKDLFQEAVDRLLEKLSWDKETVEILICVTQTPQVSIPSVSCRLQGDMGFSKNTLCFDINSGCSGFVYGLHNVYSMLSGTDNPNARAILCCGDVSSSLIESSDRTVRPVFSDAVSAIGIEMNGGNEISAYFNLETDGTGQEAIVTTPGEDGVPYMRLNGIDIFNYSLKHVPGNIKHLLEFAGKETSFPDSFVFHQANKLINESIRKKLLLDETKVPYSLYEYGNTASASIPLTLGASWKQEGAESGWILVSGFGVGFSMASALIRFNPIFCLPPVEI